jgi:hypothetical protein
VRSWISTLALVALAAGPASAITIDEFDDPDGGHLVNILGVDGGMTGDTASDTATLLAAVGGSREIGLLIEGTNGGIWTAQADVNTHSSSGVYQLSNTAAVDSVGTIIYDADGAGLNYDLGINTVLRLEGVLNDHITTYTFTLETFGGGGSVSCTQVTGSAFSGDVSCDFAGLFNGVAANNIDRISIRIDPSQKGGDVLIDRVTLVPEPTTALLFGLGTAGLAWFGSVRRRA